MRPLVIYLHGFNSSSQSKKGQQLLHYVAEQQLPIDAMAPTFANYPAQAHQQVVDLIEAEQAAGREQIALIGSSLGGFMATCVAEQFGLKAVLINPAVEPHVLVEFLLGEHKNDHTGETFVLTRQHSQELQSLELKALSRPQNYWLMLQAGDETLDYRQAKAYYQDCQQLIEQGGNHGFENFDQHLPQVMQFLELA